ncbi:PGGHG glucosidase, partial [Columbina picui]|nr:PGGHG glucosidase [Columbina picui]
MADVSGDPAVFSATALPADPRLLPTLTNACLGTQLYRDVLHLNGVYNGAAGDTHRADIPSPLSVRMGLPGDCVAETFTLDTRTGAGCDCREMTSKDGHWGWGPAVPNCCPCAMGWDGSRAAAWGHVSPVLGCWGVPARGDAHECHLPVPVAVSSSYVYGQTLVPEVAGGPRPTVHMLWTPVPRALTLPAGERERCWQFLTAVADSREEAERSYGAGLALAAAGALHASHVQAWAARWDGCGVELDGPLALRKALRGALYYLLSAIPPQGSPGFPFHGISPGGLSNGTRGEDYWGHVFWDQVHGGLGALCTWRGLGWGLQGLVLTWAHTSAPASGWDRPPAPPMSPAQPQPRRSSDISSCYIHVLGAPVLLGWALVRRPHVVFLFVPLQDQRLFREEGGWELVAAAAQYWCSRMVWSEEERCYNITGVMPPDEYHRRVDNSAYTNAVARRRTTSTNSWHVCADRPFPGEPVKQADVVLLGFPLMHPMSPRVRRNDLEMYEPVTAWAGPAMTWSMFAVGWLELKELQRAQSQLNKCFSNITEPFKIWVENADGSGAVNFLTGMGGFLQAILFGCTGFRISRSSLRFDPAFPPDVNGLTVTGVSYLGNKLQFTITRAQTRIRVSACARQPPACPLEAVLEASGQRWPLREG